MTVLSASGALRAIIVPVLIVAAVVVVIVSFFVTVIMTALGAIGVGSPFSFLDVGIAVCYLYQLADGCRPLAV